MKNTISTLLRTGFTRTRKYSVKDCGKYLYILNYILEVSPAGFISCNKNPFWGQANIKNRMELLYLVKGIRRAVISDRCYFEIVNRFENGDGFGIARE